MLEVIKEQLDANKFTLYRIVCYSYFSDEHISTYNSSPESRRPHSSKSARMHHLASLVSKFSKQFQLPKHRFKKRPNALFSFLAFKMFKAVPTFKPPFQIASECTIQLPCFQNVLSSSNFHNTVSNSARMHHFSPCFHNFLSSTNFLKIASNSARQHHVASLLLKFSQHFQFQEHRFKQRQNAPYTVLDFKTFSGVRTSETYSVRMQHLLSLLSTFSHQFQLPNTSF